MTKRRSDCNKYHKTHANQVQKNAGKKQTAFQKANVEKALDNPRQAGEPIPREISLGKGTQSYKARRYREQKG